MALGDREGARGLAAAELELALAWDTPRSIATATRVFVTMATVETHLTRVYRKLDLEGRKGLADALAAD